MLNASLNKTFSCFFHNLNIHNAYNIFHMRLASCKILCYLKGNQVARYVRVTSTGIRSKINQGKVIVIIDLLVI